jgi:PAS domain S-box-containing protein
MTPEKATCAFRLSRSVVLILLLVVAGGLFAWWMVAQSNHEMRDSLLQQARTVAQSVNRDQVKALTGTAADLDLPNYQRLKEQFTAVRLTIPQCRFLYLLGRQTGGTVFFFVDSQPTTAKDYSPPGQVYADVPAGFRRGFDSKVATVEGPVRDRGGVWASAVVPLTDPRTGAVLAVLGVEVDARDWKGKLASRTALPVGLVLVLFMGGATYLFALRRPSAARNLVVALSLLAAGLLVTGMVVLYAKANAESNALREFKWVGNEIRLDIFARLHAGAQVLHSGAALFETSGAVGREEWRTFTQGLQLAKNLPGIQGLGYASLIPRAQLAAHVAEIRQQGFPDYQVWPIGDRETYSTILYLEPFTNRNLRAFGYDMLTEPVRRAALERARDERSPALSGKVRLVQETDQDVQAGTLMFIPVYQRGWPVETVAQRRGALQGWVYSPYRMADLLQGALRVSEARFKERQIGIQVYDGEVLSADTLLYDNRSAEAEALAATPGIDWLAPVDFAGHRWTLRVVQLRGLAVTTEYGSAWIALFGGTTISLLLFGLTLSLLTTRAAAQRMAEQLEQELRASEASYRSHFVNNASMMLMVDPAEGMIIEANHAAARFYGYPHERLLTLRISDLSTASTAEVRQAMAAVLQGLSNRFEFQHRLADGSLREVEVSSGRIDFAGRTVLHSIIQDVTERKRAEHEIRRQAALISSLLDSIPDIVFFKSIEGVYLGCNPAFAAFVGRPRNEILGQTDHDLFDREIANFFREQDQQMLAKHEPRHNEEWITYPDGRKVLMDTLKTPYWGPERELIGLLGIGRDITAQRQAEDALRESEQFAQGTINAISGHLAILDERGIIITVNRPWREFAQANSGHEAALCEGANYLALCDTADGAGCAEAAAFAAGFRAIIEGRQDQFDVEYACHSPREERWFLARVTRFRRGESTYAAVVHDNITERKQVEIQLRQMTERQVLAARAGGVGIWDYDVVNNRLVWDDQMFRLYGIPRDQFSGAYEAWQAGLWPEDRPRGDQEIRLALRGEKDFDTEFRVLWPDGTTRNIRALALVQRDASGQATHMVGTNWDITAQKQAAAQLQQSNQSLERANARVTALAEQATEANRAKSEFLAVMSHEIRTPMNAVLGMTSLLLQTPLNPRQTEYARTVAASGEALLHIINDILDLSKIEAGGQFPIEEQPLSLRKLAGDLVRLLESRAQERGLALAADVAEDIPEWIKGDAGRLRQVLMNLAGNGLKFTDRGGVTIRVRRLGMEAARVRLRFEVQDTGIGLSPEDRVRLFQPFVQADSAAAQRRGGTGLGLAISKRIVELMGGRMGLESALGQGSLFWFELALEVASTPAAETEAVAIEADIAHGAAPGRPLRILVAEDHEPNRRLATYMLESLGYRADFAVNGREAVTAWERSAYDIIIMDCQMPEMDGFEATREIRQREAARTPAGGERIRIVALTANAVKGDAERCLAAGMDGYLSKPYTAQQLGAALKQHSVCSAPHAPHAPPAPPVRFDPQGPAQLCADLGDEAVRGFIEDFLADLPRQIPEIGVLAKAGRRSEAGRLAHSQRGISLSFGLVQFGAHLGEIEELAEAGDDAGWGPLLERLPAAAAQAQDDLRQWLAAVLAVGPKS